MGNRLGLEFDDVKNKHEVFTSPVDMKTDFCAVKKGTIYAHRFTMSGFVNGVEKVSLRYVHKVCHDIVNDPPMSNSIHIEGLQNLHTEIKGLMPLDESYATSTAPTVFAIPAVVGAAPGWKQAMDLPVIVPVP
jgi:hypothetical protein